MYLRLPFKWILAVTENTQIWIRSLRRDNPSTSSIWVPGQVLYVHSTSLTGWVTWRGDFYLLFTASARAWYVVCIIHQYHTCCANHSDMSQGDEHTLLEYARIHGLACNHLTRDPLKGLKAPDDYLQGLEIESDDLYDGDLKDYQLDEKLSFGKEAILLLASVTTPISSDYPPRFDVDVYNDPHPSRNFKCELPMLQTDHDLDKKEFAVPFVPHLEHEFLPLEKIDDEADEGLKWPLRNSTLLEELAEKSRSEKLQVSTETLTYLRDALISNDVDGKLEWQDGQARPYKRVGAQVMFLY